MNMSDVKLKTAKRVGCDCGESFRSEKKDFQIKNGSSSINRWTRFLEI